MLAIMDLAYASMHHATNGPFLGPSEYFICLSSSIVDSAMLLGVQIILFLL